MIDNEKLDLLLEKITGFESDMSNLKSDMQEIKQRVTKIDLTIETEIRDLKHKIS